MSITSIKQLLLNRVVDLVRLLLPVTDNEDGNILFMLHVQSV